MYKPNTYSGHSSRMRKLEAEISKAAAVDLPVLIVGETGTGKELVAQEVHARGTRANMPFVPVNTGALPPELIASELFGHARGAFTGATEEMPGRFREAGHGTIFLDEIGTMSDRAQVSLLRVIESNMVRAVGSRKEVETHARVIAATNQELPALIAEGRFREDLMYRLDVIRIEVPPLREISAEIPALANHFVRELGRKYDSDVFELAPDSLDLLMSYPWPGNIRELRNVIAHGCVSAGSGVIEPGHLPRRLHSSSGEMQPTEPDRPGTIYPVEFRRSAPTISKIRSSPGVIVPFGLTLEEAECIFVERTLEHCENNKTRTAKMLGVSRKKIYDRLNRTVCSEAGATQATADDGGAGIGNDETLKGNSYETNFGF